MAEHIMITAAAHTAAHGGENPATGTGRSFATIVVRNSAQLRPDHRTANTFAYEVNPFKVVVEC